MSSAQGCSRAASGYPALAGTTCSAPPWRSLTGVEPPPRAQWLRVAVLELSRLASHLFWWGDLGLELGAITPVFWALREREMVLDLLEMLSGAALPPRLHRPRRSPG